MAGHARLSFTTHYYPPPTTHPAAADPAATPAPTPTASGASDASPDPDASPNPLPSLASVILKGAPTPPAAAAGEAQGGAQRDDVGASPAAVGGGVRGARCRVEEEWVVCNALGGKAASDIAVQAADSSGVKMIPWVGVAARLPSAQNTGLGAPLDAYGNTSDSKGVGRVVRTAGAGSGGRAFCFLPLPVATGLPVHVNAFFELSSNRRDIW